VLNREDAKVAKIFLVEHPELDRLAFAVIGAAIEVHMTLGPGFLESVYRQALGRELELRGVPFKAEAPISVEYKGKKVGEGRLDLLVATSLVVELKTVDALTPIHTAQVLSYLKATSLRLGLLINFKVPVLQQGLKRVVRTT
jgi:GxxExxY protein